MQRGGLWLQLGGGIWGTEGQCSLCRRGGRGHEEGFLGRILLGGDCIQRQITGLPLQ